MEAISRSDELENVTTAYFLENVLVKLERRKEEIDQSRPPAPVAPTMPVAPKAPKRPAVKTSSFAREPYPSTSISNDFLFRTPVPRLPFPAKWRNLTVLFAVLAAATPLIVSIATALTAIPTSTGSILNLIAVPVFAMIGPALLITAGLAPIACLFCLIKGLAEKNRARKVAEKTADEEARRRRKEAEREMRTSAEYLRQCAEIDERNKKRQEEIRIEDERRRKEADEYYNNMLIPAYEKERESYEEAMKDYETRILPIHKKALKVYETEIIPAWEKEKTNIRAAIRKTKETLDEVYGQNVIPGKFRNLEALTFLSSFMGTSHYDLKFAIERYDKELDQIIAREHLRVGYSTLGAARDIARTNAAAIRLASRVLEEQQYANYLQEQSLNYLDKGNQLLRKTKNWSIANAAIQGFGILRDIRRERKGK